MYYIYNTGDFLRDEAQERGAASESAGGDYELSTDVYHCKKHAFHKDITPEERVNYDEPLDADKDGQIFVSQKMLIRREMEWATKFFKTGVWSHEKAGATADPLIFGTLKRLHLLQILHKKLSAWLKSGFKPNTLVLSPYVFNALKNHYDVLDRVKYTETGIVTTALLASLFGEVENVGLVVSCKGTAL